MNPIGSIGILFLFCGLLFSSATFADGVFRYSEGDPLLHELTQEATGLASANTRNIAENLIGKWNSLPESVEHHLIHSVTRPNIIWKSMVFHADRVFDATYEIAPDHGREECVSGTYRFIQEGFQNVFPGRYPNILLKPIQGNGANVMIRVDVGLDSRFPTDTVVLKFFDLDGNPHLLLSDSIQSPDKLRQVTGSEAGTEVEFSARSEGDSRAALRYVDPVLTKQICESLEHGGLSTSERNKAIIMLMNKGDETCVPLLIEYLTPDKEFLIRQNAIRALGEIADKRAVPHLISLLEQSVTGDIGDEGEWEAVLRRNAVKALEGIGDPAALPVLRKILDATPEYPSVREFASIAIRRIEGE